MEPLDVEEKIWTHQKQTNITIRGCGQSLSLVLPELSSGNYYYCGIVAKVIIVITVLWTYRSPWLNVTSTSMSFSNQLSPCACSKGVF